MKILLLAAFLALSASVAQAFPHVTVTSSEVINASPLRVKTTFNVDLVGPGGWCWIDVLPRSAWTPASGDTTHLYACSPPTGWSYYSSVDFLEFYPVGDPIPCFGAGDHFTGFSIVTNNVAPCVHIIFATPLLGLDGSYHIDACLDVDGPVPALGTTWGAIKSRYR